MPKKKSFLESLSNEQKIAMMDLVPVFQKFIGHISGKGKIKRFVIMEKTIADLRTLLPILQDEDKMQNVKKKFSDTFAEDKILDSSIIDE